MQAAILSLSITGAAVLYRGQSKFVNGLIIKVLFSAPTNAWGGIIVGGIMNYLVKPAVLAGSLVSSAAFGVFLRNYLEAFAVRQNLLVPHDFSRWEFGSDVAISLAAGTVAAVVERWYVDDVAAVEYVSAKETPKIWVRMSVTGWIVAVAVVLGLHQLHGIQ